MIELQTRPDLFICHTCRGEFEEAQLNEEGDLCQFCEEDKNSNVVPFGNLQWNDRMALDLALVLEGSGDTIDEILTHYQMRRADLRRFTTDKVFQARVANFRKEIRDEGLGFRLKAKVQAEELLTTSWNMIHDRGVSPAVKADLIKSTVKWAGLEVKPEALELLGGGTGAVQIHINLGTGQAGGEIAIAGDTYDHNAIDVQD
jgi:hypothetical protein